MSRPKSTEERVRINLDIPVSLKDDILELAKWFEAATMAEAVRRAVRLAVYILTRLRSGERLYFESPDGKKTEVIIP